KALASARRLHVCLACRREAKRLRFLRKLRPLLVFAFSRVSFPRHNPPGLGSHFSSHGQNMKRPRRRAALPRSSAYRTHYVIEACEPRLLLVSWGIDTEDSYE